MNQIEGYHTPSIHVIADVKQTQYHILEITISYSDKPIQTIPAERLHKYIQDPESKLTKDKSEEKSSHHIFRIRNLQIKVLTSSTDPNVQSTTYDQGKPTPKYLEFHGDFTVVRFLLHPSFFLIFSYSSICNFCFVPLVGTILIRCPFSKIPAV